MKSWLKRFNRLRALPLPDQVLLVRTAAALLLARAALLVLPLPRVHQGFLRLIATSRGPSLSSAAIARQVWAIGVLGRRLNAKCLPQALTLKYFLRADPTAQLMIGVRQNSIFEAHAWVQQQQRILIGDFPHFDYQLLWRWDHLEPSP